MQASAVLPLPATTTTDNSAASDEDLARHAQQGDLDAFAGLVGCYGAGGLLGMAFGMGVARLVSLSGLLTAIVSPTSTLLAITFSIAVGVFFGIYPAARAAALNPIDALRYE